MHASVLPDGSGLLMAGSGNDAKLRAPAADRQVIAVGARLAAGTTLKSVRVFRLMSTTHQFGAAEGDFTLARSGSGWSLTTSANLTPPGYYDLVAVDSRDVPSVAKIVKVT